jgi:hemerythrin-like domain-containing protein
MSEPTDHPTSVLREEHRVILRVLDVLSRLLDAGEQGGNWHFDALEECITFFRLYADACHHGKEEDLLFRELEAKGMPVEGGPIAVMLHEHRLGREHVRAMAAALPGARAGDREALGHLLAEGRGYIELLSSHIGKEDHCLFAMADQMIGGAACRGLCQKYREVSGGRFEETTKEALEELASRLEAVRP